MNNHSQQLELIKSSLHLSSTNAKPFHELYQLENVLGKGSYGIVREGVSLKNSGNISSVYAVKCVDRRKLSQHDEESLMDEVSILCDLQHNQIIRMYDVFVEANRKFYVVMELANGGELFDRIVEKGQYTEQEARTTCQKLLEAVDYIHYHNIAHRDLKPDNILLASKENDTDIKLADFGFATKVWTPNSLTTLLGTVFYMAPELFTKLPSYDERVDMWSVGVILYVLLSGYLPFDEENGRELSRKIRKGAFEFHESCWGSISVEAKHLIASLLEVDPDIRSTASESLDHPWIHGNTCMLTEKEFHSWASNSKINTKKGNFGGKGKYNVFPAARSLVKVSVKRIKNFTGSRAA